MPPNELVPDKDLRALGLAPTAIAAAELIHEKHGNRLYRIRLNGPSGPGLGEPGPAVEIQAYELLGSLSVPTLPVHGLSPRAILLEDLDASPDWRQVATDPVGPPAFLRREVDELSPEVILGLGRRLGLPDLPVWRLAADCIDTNPVFPSEYARRSSLNRSDRRRFSSPYSRATSGWARR